MRTADTAPRGLTGTDNSFVGYARAMAARGHEVTAYMVGHEACVVDGMAVQPFNSGIGGGGGAPSWALNDTFDAVLSWCEPDALRLAHPSCVRLLNCQLNNFDAAHTRHEDCIDVYTAPSKSLAARLAVMMRAPERFCVLPNGCDPSLYDLDHKIPGRCIYASSPDRGLHVALHEWADVRRSVPDATLKIYYHSMQHWFDNIEDNRRTGYWTNQEHAWRASMVRGLITQDGVEHVGSVSRVEMAKAYSEAMVLAYPCDTITYTEGFGVAVLEGSASGAVPVVSSEDAFGEVYGGTCPMVPPRAWDHRREWAEMTIRCLTDEAYRSDWVKRGRALAAKHAWPVLAKKLERILVEARANKFTQAAA